MTYDLAEFGMYPYLIFIGGFNAGKNFHNFSLLLYKKSIHVQQIFQANWTVSRIHKKYFLSLNFWNLVNRRKNIKESVLGFTFERIRWFHFIFLFLTAAPNFSPHILNDESSLMTVSFLSDLGQIWMRVFNSKWLF